MLNTARILRFPDRFDAQDVSPEEASGLARGFLETPCSERSDELKRDLLTTEVVFAICKILRDDFDSNPSRVAEEARMLFSWLGNPECKVGVLDERDYLCGEVAFLAAGAFRHVGKREEADRWLNRADASFRHTLNPAPKLADVSYLRMALVFDARQFQDVVEMTPSLLKSFAKLGMRKELAKTLFLQAMALKGSSSPDALNAFNSLAARLDPAVDTRLLGQVLIEIGAFDAAEGRYQEALAKYNTALSLLKQGNHPLFVAHLKATVGETLRRKGELPQAVVALRDAISDYDSLSMITHVAYLRVILAEALLAQGRFREVEWEILAALPTIEERKMVPEGFAAVALLRESMRLRKTDANALRELREHLQAEK